MLNQEDVDAIIGFPCGLESVSHVEFGRYFHTRRSASLFGRHCSSTTFREPEDEADKEDCTHGEFECRWGVGGGEEGFERAGDDEQGDGSGDELDGFGSGNGDGFAAAEEAGEEDACSEAEAGGPGEHDAGEFEGAVGGDEAGDVEQHVMLRAGGEDDAEHHAVVVELEEGSEACDDASGEGDEADADVVRHDERREGGLGAKDGVGPHLVVVDGVHHGGAEVECGKVRADESDERAEDCGDDGDRGREVDVGRHAAEEARVTVGDEVPEADGRDTFTGVDEVVGAADELVEVLLEGAGGAVGADGGEIGGGLAVEQAEFAEFCCVKRSDASAFDLTKERVEPVPVILTVSYPQVGDHVDFRENRLQQRTRDG